jgi:hypothetical protein
MGAREGTNTMASSTHGSTLLPQPLALASAHDCQKGRTSPCNVWMSAAASRLTSDAHGALAVTCSVENSLVPAAAAARSRGGRGNMHVLMRDRWRDRRASFTPPFHHDDGVGKAVGGALPVQHGLGV